MMMRPDDLISIAVDTSPGDSPSLLSVETGVSGSTVALPLTTVSVGMQISPHSNSIAKDFSGHF